MTAPTKTVIVRPATTDDSDQISEIYNHYIRTSTITFEEVPIDAAEMSRRISAVQADSLPWLVAVDKNEIKGFAYAQKWKVRAAYRNSVEVTVYVRTGLDRSGIGTALYERLLELLGARKIHAAIGGIALPNEASVRLHEKIGFRKVAHFEEVGFKFDRWIDVAYWQKLL